MLALLARVGALPSASGPGGDPGLVHACVHQANGHVWIVGAAENCKLNETPMD